MRVQRLAALALALALAAGAGAAQKKRAPAPKDVPQPEARGTGKDAGQSPPPEEIRRAAEAAAHPLDRFGPIPCGDELARLDSLANDMKANPSMTAYIVASGPRRPRPHELRSRLLRMQAYLVNKRGIPRSSVVAVDSGRGDELKFVVFLWPRDAQPPVDKATLRAGRVSLPRRARRVTDCQDSYDRI